MGRFLLAIFRRRRRRGLEGKVQTSLRSCGCADVLVLGAGIAGLAAALGLARAGIPVEVLERDQSPAPAGRRSAGSWRRDGVPQANQGHVFSPGVHRILADQLPDVLDQLIELGARQLGNGEQMSLAVRRPVFDWVLRRVAEREPALRVHNGVSVRGLTRRADDGGGLSGVSVLGGVIQAAVAVDGTGVSGATDRWLGELGCPVMPEPTRRPDQAVVVEYYSRDYALHWPEDPGELNLGTAAGGMLPGYTCTVVPGDNKTFTVTFAVSLPEMPQQARPTGSIGLTTPEGFQAAARLVPMVSGWVDPCVAQPLGAVNVLRPGTSNKRRVPAGNGLPGLIAVGDASSTDAAGRRLGVASALASGLAAARVIPDILAGREPDVGSIAALAEQLAGDGWAGPPHSRMPELDGPSVADIAEASRRLASVPA